MEIQRYAEDEDDEDYSDIFSRIEVTPIKADSESESEQGTLMLNSKLSNNSWLGDDDDEDDPFAQLEEGFDEMDLQANLARDKFARLCTQVEGLVGSLKISQPDEVLADLSDQLVKHTIVTNLTLLTTTRWMCFSNHQRQKESSLLPMGCYRFLKFSRTAADVTLSYACSKS